MQIGVTCRTQLRRPSSKLYVLKKSAFGKGRGGHGCRWGWGGRAGPSGHPGLLLPPLRHPTVEKQPVQPGVLPPCTAGEAVGAPPPPSSPARGQGRLLSRYRPVTLQKDNATRVLLSHEHTTFSRKQIFPRLCRSASALPPNPSSNFSPAAFLGRAALPREDGPIFGNDSYCV